MTDSPGQWEDPRRTLTVRLRATELFHKRGWTFCPQLSSVAPELVKYSPPQSSQL